MAILITISKNRELSLRWGKSDFGCATGGRGGEIWSEEAVLSTALVFIPVSYKESPRPTT
jgi:hypothetical protein